MEFFLNAFLSRMLFVLFTLFLALLIFIYADLVFIKKKVTKNISPVWPVLLISYWTIVDRLDRKLSTKINNLLIEFYTDTSINNDGIWNKEKREKFLHWLSSAPNNIEIQLRAVNIELKKLDSDISLLDEITEGLYGKSKIIWPDFLLLIVPSMRQFPAIKNLHSEVKALRSVVERHNKLLIPHIDSFLLGHHDKDTSKVIANYLPYFNGSDVRLIETLNGQRIKECQTDIKKYFLRLNIHLGAIKSCLTKTRIEINRVSFFGQFVNKMRNKPDELNWYEIKDIWDDSEVKK